MYADCPPGKDSRTVLNKTAGIELAVLEIDLAGASPLDGEELPKQQPHPWITSRRQAGGPRGAKGGWPESGQWEGPGSPVRRPPAHKAGSAYAQKAVAQAQLSTLEGA